MNNATRVYGRAVDLDGAKIKNFFNKRALDYEDKTRSRNTTVLLGDSDAEYAERWDSFEKSFVLPMLCVKKTDDVLDIGCGIGRWAECLIPLCNSYTGVDLSEEMIRIAAETYRDNHNSEFVNLSFQDIFDNTRISGRTYRVIIITGVSMYLNDSELEECYSKLRGLIAPGGILYIEESVGINERLSLNNLWSESLKDHYCAVYRTVDEYKKLLNPLIEISDILRDGFLHELDKQELSETGHWFILLKRLQE